MKLQKVKRGYHVYIPRNLVEDVLMWKKGDTIDYIVIYEEGIPVLKLRKSIQH
jgi:bifunctional DNA-binding transcriptional regulator/antitoxin component of YhaV-PrlF toxin-antitoxin module